MNSGPKNEMWTDGFHLDSCRTMSSEGQAGAVAPEQLANAVKTMDVKDKSGKKGKGDSGHALPLEVSMNASERLTTV